MAGKRLSVEQVLTTWGIEAEHADRLTTAERAMIVPLYREAETVHECEARRAKHEKSMNEAAAERDRATEAADMLAKIKARLSS